MRNVETRPRRRTTGLKVEGLESRAMLTGVPGVDYTPSGFTWSDPGRLTYSVAPDGVFWDHGVSTLQADFDARFGKGVWERELARALATWESVANLNIAQVGDGAYPMNALGKAQGDPRFGDVRFGGYAYPGDTTTLAQTYFPPPNGATEAGDVSINTGVGYAKGADVDLYSVMLHETGHSLGLDHIANPVDVMDPTYQGVRSGLAPGDVAGIQSLYGARATDAFQSQGRGTSIGTAVDLTGVLDPGGWVVQRGVSLATVGDVEYFSVVVPAGATGVVRAAAITQGVSLLSPKVVMFDASLRPLAWAADPSTWGVNAVAAYSGVAPGQRIYVGVTGATADAFSVGAYALAVAFEGVNRPPADTPTAPDRYEPNDTPATATRLPAGAASPVVVVGLSLHNGSDVDDFAWQNTKAGVYVAAAATSPGSPPARVRVLTASGAVLADGLGTQVFRLGRPGMKVVVEVTSPTGRAVPNYGLVLVQVPGVSAAGTARAELARPLLVAGPAPVEAAGWVAAWSKGRGKAAPR